MDCNLENGNKRTKQKQNKNAVQRNLMKQKKNTQQCRSLLLQQNATVDQNKTIAHFHLACVFIRCISHKLQSECKFSNGEKCFVNNLRLYNSSLEAWHSVDFVFNSARRGRVRARERL